MTAISKNVYFDVLDEIVNKYNNTVHKTIKMKPIDVTSDYNAKYNENLSKKILNLKLKFFLEFQSIKIFSQKDMLQISQKEFLLLLKLKIQFLGLVINDLNDEEIAESFYEKKLQKTSQEELRIERIIKRKGDKLYV